MSKKLRQQMEIQIKEALAREPSTPPSGPTALDVSASSTRKQKIKAMRSFLSVYGGNHPLLLRQKQRFEANRKWKPTDREVDLFFTSSRALFRNAGLVNEDEVADFIYEMEEADQASSLDP